MASITPENLPENLTVKLNLKGSVILGIEEYNELRLRADQYDEMLFSCVENFEVVDKEPSTWSHAACTIEGHFEIPTGIFNAVINSIVSKLISNDDWMASIAKGAVCWLDLSKGMLTTYEPSSPYRYYLLDNKQFADKYFEDKYLSLIEKGGDNND